VEKTSLGKSGIEVSTLAMGSDSIGSKIDRDTSFELLDAFYAKGGTFLDTANMYAFWVPGCTGGESESTIGAWMKERRNRDQLVISSKLAFDYPTCAGGLNAGEITRECDKTLRRLQTDRIDVYYAHRDDRETALEETMEAFHRLVQAGKVRALGASNVPTGRIVQANCVAEAHQWSTYSVVQQRYTYLRPRHGADFGPQIFLGAGMKDYAQSIVIGLVGYSVLLQGAYTRPDRPLPAQFAGPDADARLQVLQSIAGAIGCSPNQVVIAWMRQSTPSILPIIAASKIDQLEENLAALEVKLTGEQMQQLNTAGDPVIERAWLQPT
jgi:aryl-alcohol dehydrogenase-like predicted oxidoreductase